MALQHQGLVQVLQREPACVIGHGGQVACHEKVEDPQQKKRQEKGAQGLGGKDDAHVAPEVLPGALEACGNRHMTQVLPVILQVEFVGCSAVVLRHASCLDDAFGVHFKARVGNIGQAGDSFQLHPDQLLVNGPGTAGEAVAVARLDHAESLFNAGDIRAVADPDLNGRGDQRENRAAQHDQPQQSQRQGRTDNGTPGPGQGVTHWAAARLRFGRVGLPDVNTIAARA